MIRHTLLAAYCSLLAGPLAAAPHFPKPTGYIADMAGIMDASTKSRLEDRLAEFERQSSIEIAVVTVQSLEGEAVEDYAVKLFKAWGVGKKGKDNGVLVLVAPTEHRTRIEVGYGLEPILTDGLCGEIIREDMIPNFKAGNFSKGIEGGVRTIEKILSGNPPARAPAPAPATEESKPSRTVLVGLIVLMLPLLTILPFTILSLTLVLVASMVFAGWEAALYVFTPLGLVVDFMWMRRRTSRGFSSYHDGYGSGFGGFGGGSGFGGFGGGSSGGGSSFGGFGGGSSGGGGASGRW